MLLGWVVGPGLSKICQFEAIQGHNNNHVGPYLVNHMRNAVLENQVRLRDQPTIDVVSPAADANGKGLASLRGEDGPVLQIGQVADAGNDMVRDELRRGGAGVAGGECSVRR